MATEGERRIANSQKSLSRQSVEGTALLIATRFIVRLIGFVSVSVTARLLTPEDFGLVGAASIVIGLFAILNQIGVNEYIIRTQKIDDEELQTIWTLRLLISAGIALIIFLTAPLAAGFLQEDRLVDVLRALSVASLLGALQSPASSFFNRDLAYGKELLLKSADKIVAVTVTITCAYIFRTYWALVWGQLAGMAFSIISSQVARPFKPTLSLSKSSNVGSFAFWTFMMRLNGYGVRNVDEWVAKRSSDSAAFGAYHISRDLCRLFVAEILAPAGQVFFPGASRVQDDPERLNEVVSRFAGAAFIVSFAVAAGISAVSAELVYLLLGYQWGQAIAYMPYVATGTAAVVLADMFAGLYVIRNQQNISTRIKFLRLVLLGVGCGYAAKNGYGLAGVAFAFSLISIVSVFGELAWLFSGSKFRVSLLRESWRPALAAIAMYSAVSAIMLPDSWSLIAIAGIKVVMGALCFVVFMGLLWWLSGRPKGGETEIIERVRDYF